MDKKRLIFYFLIIILKNKINIFIKCEDFLKTIIKNRDVEILNYLREYPDEVVAKLRIGLFQKGGYDSLKDSIKRASGLLSIFIKDLNNDEWQFCFWEGEKDLDRLVKWLI
ncbi:MAG: hypothetical protein M0Q13_11345 [Methanothrix sp.]|nr:hypothetical protein [Methanothrix sp.]